MQYRYKRNQIPGEITRRTGLDNPLIKRATEISTELVELLSPYEGKDPSASILAALLITAYAVVESGVMTDANGKKLTSAGDNLLQKTIGTAVVLSKRQLIAMDRIKREQDTRKAREAN